MTLSKLVVALTLAASSSAFAFSAPSAARPAEFNQLSKRGAATICSITLRVVGNTARVAKQFTRKEQDTFSLTAYTLSNVWAEQAIKEGATGDDVRRFAYVASDDKLMQNSMEYCAREGNNQFGVLRPSDKAKVELRALNTLNQLDEESPR